MHENTLLALSLHVIHPWALSMRTGRPPAPDCTLMIYTANLHSMFAVYRLGSMYLNAWPLYPQDQRVQRLSTAAAAPKKPYLAQFIFSDVKKCWAIPSHAPPYKVFLFFGCSYLSYKKFPLSSGKINIKSFSRKNKVCGKLC